MQSSFSKLLVSFDDFGHSFALTYKGQETHQTLLGGILSFLIKAMTITMIILLTKSMLLMEDPEIVSYSR